MNPSSPVTMSRLASSALGIAILLGGARPALAQGKVLPVRPLGAVEHASTELLAAVSAVRALPGGRVLVNDISGRKVVLFDSTLATTTIIADTTSATANAYSSRAVGLLAYKGDSSLIVDPSSLSMLMLDPVGKVARVMSVPRPNEAGVLIGGPNGTPGFDAQGRLVYRQPPNFRMQRPANGVFTPPEPPDSLPLVRIELASRKVDTIGYVKVPKTKMNVSQDANGRVSVSPTINPMQVVDDYAVLSDGSVAIVRGRDYHVDWIRADGSAASSGKIPFQWRHLSDSDKVAFIDSTRVAMEKLRAQFLARQAAGGANGAVGQMTLPPEAAAMGGGAPMIFMRMDGGGERGNGENPRPRNEAGPGGMPTNIQIPALQFVPPTELPDYAPPFSAGAVRADRDGNIWIRTSTVVNGGSVYDVVDAKGELVDRVQLPANRVIAGFAPGGVVYMGVREEGGARLEQARRK
jgi:hypothetical protein